LNLLDIFQNEIIIVSIFSWAVAQIIKTIIHAIMYKGIDWKRLVGDGGMPSAHSATVTSLAIYTGLTYGFKSAVFAVALIFAIIVMHDAMGVRREAGRHAKALNELYENMDKENQDKENPTPDVMLKEFLGHSPLQVLMGALLGLAIALTYYYVV